MKLWTIQPIEFYQTVCLKNEIYNSAEFIESDFKESYDWMTNQMEIRIGKKTFQNSYPLWAWFQYESEKKKKPDLRHSGFLEKGAKGVRIEFEKPEKEILLSDFDLWHFVLNYWHIADDENKEKEFDNLLKTNKIKFIDKEKYLPEIKKKVENSWNKIFDMDYDLEYAANHFTEKSIQATFWNLKKEEIINVDFFTAK